MFPTLLKRRLPIALALLAVMLICQCAFAPLESKTELKSGAQTARAAVLNGFTDADFAKHVNELKKRLPSDAFSIVIQPPFVVIGDDPRPDVEKHARDNVKWAVDRLKQDFFTKDPEQILDIWLFKDADSYQKHTGLLFGDEPTTPYGYYSTAHKALIMNIGTGTGTLVHELVHPYIEANFPACPPWLNEGLGSLYEQCGEVDGHIHGFVNWRLPALQRAVRAGTVPTFKELTAMDSTTFYGDTRGVNYSQARYLCYYLQEKRLLVSFYKEFHSEQKNDPTGYRSLQKVLGESDMVAFQKKWSQFVLNLSRSAAITVEVP